MFSGQPVSSRKTLLRIDVEWKACWASGIRDPLLPCCLLALSETTLMTFAPKFDPKMSTIELDGAMVSLHCHHYNCGLLKALEEIPGVDAHDILMKTAAEEFYKNFKAHLAKGGKEFSIKTALREAAGRYRFMGFGAIDLRETGAEGGTAYSDSSYFVVGWLAKFGRRKAPVCFLTCGFLAGILAVIHGAAPDDYTVRETECLVSGSDRCTFTISRKPHGH